MPRAVFANHKKKTWYSFNAKFPGLPQKIQWPNIILKPNKLVGNPMPKNTVPKWLASCESLASTCNSPLGDFGRFSHPCYEWFTIAPLTFSKKKGSKSAVSTRKIPVFDHFSCWKTIWTPPKQGGAPYLAKLVYKYYNWGWLGGYIYS